MACLFEFIGSSFVDAPGLPAARPALPHPLRVKRSFDAVAADFAPVTVVGVWPLPHRRRMGEVERNFGPLDFRLSDGPVSDACLAVDRGTDVVAECARQRGAIELELQNLGDGMRLGVGGGNGHFPRAGRIDGWFPCPDGCADDA